ncbi:MAG TPA: PRC-barrel domain-containing protein [Beijerinckiaceae bacterium]|nr:PRC-barrel domain-containing protein [Beijerinckiaceae bacterium]
MTPGTGPAASSAPASSAPGTAASATAGASASDTGGSSPSRAATAPASGAPGQHPPQGQFVAQQQQGQWLASKLIGTRVVGANNETIGDVNDVLLDRSGTAQAIVIGVGGFLGIGEKDVAVPFNALEFASAREMATTASTSPGGSGGASSTGGATSTGAGASSNAARNGDGERIVLRLTKADLQAAPTFHSNRASSTTSGAGNAGNGRPGAASGGSAPSRP